MYFVGIDISKYKHDCFIVTEAGEVIDDTFAFYNTRTGFNQFFSILDVLVLLNVSECLNRETIIGLSKMNE